MKYFILLVFLFSASIAYAQNPDLIVTHSGDSIKCKLVKVGTEEIQFRIGSGNTIIIDRSEVASYQYNFGRVVTPRVKKEKTATGYPPLYLAITAGKSAFGTASFGEITNGGPGVFGADIAYFFSSWLGAGLKLNAGVCNVDFGESIDYQETVMFVGPAFYGRFGKGAFAFTVAAGGGLINWKPKMNATVSGMTQTQVMDPA